MWCSSGQVVMAGRAGRLLTPSVLLSVWSMSVRCRSEVWERYRRSPYCHSSLLWQDGADQTGDGLAVGEDLDDVCAALDLAVEALDGVVGPDLGPVLAGEGGERGQVRLGVLQHLSDSEGKASFKASMTCWYWAVTASRLV